jgi:hypothetical protein
MPPDPFRRRRYAAVGIDTQRIGPGGSNVENGEGGSAHEPLTHLRGAGVDVDLHRIARVILAVVLLALAVTAGILFSAGAQKNAQITRLRQHGVPVEITVSGCLGLLGGSGSNAAGYACAGSFTLAGHVYRESIPGDTHYRPGATVRGVTDPDDPGLLATAGMVSAEHPSGNVFILPAVLAALFALGVGFVLLRWRRATRASTNGSRA